MPQIATFGQFQSSIQDGRVVFSVWCDENLAQVVNPVIRRQPGHYEITFQDLGPGIMFITSTGFGPRGFPAGVTNTHAFVRSSNYDERANQTTYIIECIALNPNPVEGDFYEPVDVNFNFLIITYSPNEPAAEFAHPISQEWTRRR